MTFTQKEHELTNQMKNETKTNVKTKRIDENRKQIKNKYRLHIIIKTGSINIEIIHKHTQIRALYIHVLCFIYIHYSKCSTIFCLFYYYNGISHPLLPHL